MLKVFGGGRLFGVRSGEGQAQVLALHGWRRSHADFIPMIGELEAHPPAVIALDLPGFGASPAPAEPIGSAGYAQLIGRVLDEMAEQVVVVGHSFGGRVAVQMALAHPDRVRGLVLSGVPLLRLPGAAPPRLGATFRAGRFLHRAGVIGDSTMERLRDHYGSEDYRVAEGVMRAVLVRAVGETYEEELSRLTCPVDLLWGAADTVEPPEIAEEAAALLASSGVSRGSRVTVVEGQGHLLPVTAPVELARAVRRQLGAVTAGGSGQAPPVAGQKP
ncbi:MAG: alpha/beta fold hydrolase [Acidimicrobiales bacterium]